MDDPEIARTQAGLRVLETSHPPVYYFPPDAIRKGTLVPAQGASLCEWKEKAMYFDVVSPKRRAVRAAWAYLSPTPPFAVIAGHVAFYAAPMDACYVGRAGATAARRLLWRMDYLKPDRSLQGKPRSGRW